MAQSESAEVYPGETRPERHEQHLAQAAQHGMVEDDEVAAHSARAPELQSARQRALRVQLSSQSLEFHSYRPVQRHLFALVRRPGSREQDHGHRRKVLQASAGEEQARMAHA